MPNGDEPRSISGSSIPVDSYIETGWAAGGFAAPGGIGSLAMAQRRRQVAALLAAALLAAACPTTAFLPLFPLVPAATPPTTAFLPLFPPVPAATHPTTAFLPLFPPVPAATHPTTAFLPLFPPVPAATHPTTAFLPLFPCNQPTFHANVLRETTFDFPSHTLQHKMRGKTIFGFACTSNLHGCRFTSPAEIRNLELRRGHVSVFLEHLAEVAAVLVAELHSDFLHLHPFNQHGLGLFHLLVHDELLKGDA